MKKEKPEIIKELRDNLGIIEFHARKKVVKIGDGAHIVLPKELLDEIVEIIYLRKVEGGKKE